MYKIIISIIAIILLSPDIYAQDIRPRAEIPKPMLRHIEFMRERGDPASDLRFRRRAAIGRMDAMARSIDKSRPQLLSDLPEWTNIGPFEIGGRIKSVIPHPQRPGTVYIGAAAGGVWRTTDSGNSWEPLSDFQSGLAMGSIAIHPASPDLLYAATGEAVPGGNNIYLGCGILRSTDAGRTWGTPRLTEVGAFSKIYIHPADPQVIVAGAVIDNSGFYVSTDAGESWTKKSDIPVTDITIHPENPDEYIIAGYGEGIFKTTDLGDSWSECNLPYPGAIGRISVQRAANNKPEFVYALAEAGNDAQIYASTDGGNSWQHVFTGGYEFFNGQGFYNNFVMIHPNNERVVFAGGIDLWKSTDAGNSWRNVTHGYDLGTVHVDQHHLGFDPENPDIIYLGNDGGMYRSTDLGEKWTQINNNLQVTQFYAMAIDNAKKNVNFGGTQDNGTLGNHQNQQWRRITSGDGFKVIVDPENSNIIYGEYYHGDLWRKNLATNTLTGITNGIPYDDEGAWEAPLVMDPHDNKTLYHARTRVYRTTNAGDRWEAISDYYHGSFSAIAVSPFDRNIIYAGTELGELIVSTNYGTTWRNTQRDGTPMRYITDIVASDHDAGAAWAAYSGYGTARVLHTSDTGRTWHD
ncbi:MAG: WD40/YVTN/BNR-like repeat-containing protein, partial [Candidatus Kapaibacterium sp.]